jgi:predicted phage terminase large subunit-like protein
VSGYIQASDFMPLSEEDKSKPHRIYVGMDPAITKASQSDRTAIVIGGLTTEGWLDILDVRRGKWDSLQLMDEMFSVQETWNPEEWFIENGQILKAIQPMLEQEMRGRGTFLNVTPMIPMHNKVIRGRSLQRRMRTHNMRFDTERSWYPGFVNEMISFRGDTETNDQFDAAAWLCLGLDKRGVLPQTEEEKDDDEAFWQKHAYQKESRSDGRSKYTGY